ncbi:hypothetical protein RB597_000201 [Gaeumannomyces tritici]
MLVSIGRRASARRCLQQRSSSWRGLRPWAVPASLASSAAGWPTVTRAYSSRTSSSSSSSSRSGAHNGTRSSSSPRPQRPATIAVLGGGLTGLTTAFYLTKFLPSARITLYEASDRLGGWVDSHTMDLRRTLPDGRPARVVCEYGPRLVSPTGKNFADTLVYAELLHHLDLRRMMWTLDKNRVGLTPDHNVFEDIIGRRYIYYPDHLVEVTGLPKLMWRFHPLASLGVLLRYLCGMARKLVTEPMFDGAGRALAAWISPKGRKLMRERGAKARHKLVEVLAATPDESIGDFFARMLGGRKLVDNVLAAMVHGIYGGDPWRLSVQSSIFMTTVIRRAAGLRASFGLQSKANTALTEEIYLDLTNKGDAIRALFSDGIVSFDRVAANGFKNGFSTFTNAMADALRANPNVEIRLNEPVTSLTYVQAGQESSVRVKTNKNSQSFNKVISTIYAKTLADIADGRLPALADTEAVTMQVVNLYYPDPGLNHPHRGFGYLVPPTADVEPGVLGVIFDSDREGAITAAIARRHLEWRARHGDPDLTVPQLPHPSGDTIPGTKLTVMLRLDEQTGPRTDDEACRLAHAVVCRHLSLPHKYSSRDRTFASVKTARDCIPQHRVGHRARLAAAHAQLLAAYGGRLAVAGPSYTAPGLLPAMRAARDVAAEVAGCGYETAYARRMALDPGAHLTLQFDRDPDFDPVREVVGVGDTGLARFRDDKTWASDFFPFSKRVIRYPGFDNKPPRYARWDHKHE